MAQFGLLGWRQFLGACLVRGQDKIRRGTRTWEVTCLLAATVTKGGWSTKTVSLVMVAQSKDNEMWKSFWQKSLEEDLTVVCSVFQKISPAAMPDGHHHQPLWFDGRAYLLSLSLF